MAVMKEQSIPRTSRKLRTHSKSRRGCVNCKLRKVKCDEAKPACQKCKAYDVICSYDPKAPSLQLSVPGLKSNGIGHKSCPGLETIVSIGSIPPTPDSPPSIFTVAKCTQFDRWNYELLDKFHKRTISTLGMGLSRTAHHNTYIQLALQHPFLLHIILTVTIMHDRYLGVNLGEEQSKAMAFHWSQGASIMNQKLSRGVLPSERDALWASAALLGALTFASLEAEASDKAWPMKVSAPSDLDWLHIIQGKKALWKVADPSRPDSVFYPHAPNFLQYSLLTSFWIPEMEYLPVELLRVCNINRESTPETNLYLAPVSALAQLLPLECNAQSFGKFMCFFGVMVSEFKCLLAQKDPCALLILAFWYAKVCDYQQWWLQRRAVLECRAICKWLRLYYSNDHNIQKLVRVIEGFGNQLEAI